MNLLLKGDEVNLVNELVYIVSISAVAEGLQGAAIKLGVAGESPELNQINSNILRFSEQRKASRNAMNDAASLAEQQGGVIANLSIPMIARQVNTPPGIREADLKPGRLADHAVLSMGSLLILWVFFGIVLLAVFLYRFRVSGPIRGVLKRVVQLLRLTDWIWILAVAVLLPIALMTGISIFSPFAGNEISLAASRRDWGFSQPVAFYVAMFLGVLVVATEVTRWRLSVSAAALGFRHHWWMALLPMAGLLAFVFGYFEISEKRLLVGLIAPAFIWLVVGGSRALFSAQKYLVLRTAVAKTLIPPIVLAMCWVVAVAFGMKRLNQYWFERDDFMKLTTESAGAIPYEYRAALQLRKEIRAALAGDLQDQ
jgi:hypothetical protein